MNTESQENSTSDNHVEKEPIEEIDWAEYGRRQQEDQEPRPLDRTDYIALFIASLQTIFLPIVILIVLLIATNFILQLAVGPVG
jgi:hypothetical protein